MKKFIAILRGINVSGHKKIKMADLSKQLTELGLHNVQTYIQSGNILFEYELVDEVVLEKKIQEKIQKDYGFTVPVIVRDTDAWNQVYHHNPFLNERQEDIKYLHVTFLAEKPEEERVAQLRDFTAGEDEFIIADQAIYLFCPNGYGRTKLTNTFFENKLKVTATTRNWKTVTKLLEMASA